jgi:hypothetical protein
MAIAVVENQYHIADENKRRFAVSDEASYLRAILATVARQAFPPERLAGLVTPHVGGAKQIAAYNLCDGAHTQTQIAESVGLDKSNLSKSIGRWIDLGIVLRIGEGADARLVHVYPLPKDQYVKRGKKNAR